MRNKIISKKNLAIFILIIVILALFVFYYLGGGAMIKKLITFVISKWRFAVCMKKFDAEKLDVSNQKIWFDDELGHMMRNSITLESVSSDDPNKCLYFKDKKVANSLFSSEICLESQQTIKALYDFADKLKQKIPESDFLKECRLFYLNKAGFKTEVTESERDSRSRAFCQSMYLSYQKKAVVLNDPNFYNTDFAGAPTCDCLGADGKQRICKTALCRTMEFVVAVSKNDQSLCSKLDDTDILPFCRLYFDKQALDKYNDIFKERYCKKASSL